MADCARAECVAWRRIEDALPSKQAAGIVYAQYGIETGAGGFAFCHNLFNHKISDAQVAAGVPYMMLAGTWEIINGKKVIFQPPHRATWFRAFASLDEAMEHHLGALKSGHYAPAWSAIVAGDVNAYARRLRALGYFTADADAYAAGMLPHFERFMKARAYEDALTAIRAAQDAETDRELPNPPSEPTIVHPPVPIRGHEDDEPDEPDDAA